MSSFCRLKGAQKASCFPSRCRKFRPCHHRFVGGSSRSSSIADILRDVQSGKIDITDAEVLLSKQNGDTDPALTTLQSFANIDHFRNKRTGFPEAVFSQGKTAAQVAAILDNMAFNVNKRIEQQSNSTAVGECNSILATRVTPEMYREISNIPLKHGTITYHETARIISMDASKLSPSEIVDTNNNIYPTVVVATAGTTDLPVAEEAAVVLEAAGVPVDRLTDVGVAGLHRILQALPRLQNDQIGCVIVCAGMDGALPSVVGGLVSVPVIATPTSIGYGASFGGVSAMLTMLNSCSPGVSVVNIDNGFGAAASAFKIVKRQAKR